MRDFFIRNRVGKSFDSNGGIPVNPSTEAALRINPNDVKDFWASAGMFPMRARPTPIINNISVGQESCPPCTPCTTIALESRPFASDALLFSCMASSMVIALATAQSINMPILNVLAIKYNDGDKRYPEIIKEIYQKEGVQGFYKTLFSNTARRSLSGLMPIALAKTVGERFDQDPLITAVFATSVETLISLAKGEVNERHMQSRSTLPPRHEKAIASIAARNFLFALSVMKAEDFSISATKKFYETFPQYNQCDEEALQKKFSMLFKIALIATSTPLDRLATQFSAGLETDAIIKNVKEKPTKFLNGIGFRTLFGVISSTVIASGIQAGNQAYQKLESSPNSTNVKQ